MDVVHFEAAAARIGGRAQYLLGLAHDLILRIVALVGPAQRDDARPDEAAEIVDMAIGLVEGETAGQPDHPVKAEIVAELPLDLFPAQMAVAVAVQQALLGGHQRALPVALQAAAFRDQRRAVAVHPLRLQHLAGDEVVEVPGA